MKVNSINSICLNQNHISRKIKQNEEPAPKELPTDSVSFKGAKNALKGGAILGTVGAIVGAIVSGGTSLIPTMVYFGACNGFIGAFVGKDIDDN